MKTILFALIASVFVQGAAASSTSFDGNQAREMYRFLKLNPSVRTSAQTKDYPAGTGYARVTTLRLETAISSISCNRIERHILFFVYPVEYDCGLENRVAATAQ